MTLESLLNLIGKEDDRKLLVELVGEYGSRQQMPASRDQTLDRIMHQVQLHYRAIRHPLPTRQDIEGMLASKFSKGP